LEERRPILAGLYKLLITEAPQGSDVLLVANDEGQAGDDLDLAKKLVRVNPVLVSELQIMHKAIRRKHDEPGKTSPCRTPLHPSITLNSTADSRHCGFKIPYS
jgi:hypothetical protein